MRVIVHGASGHMGRLIAAAAREGSHGAELAAEVGRSLAEASRVHSSLDACVEEADCVVDFSNASAIDALLAFGRSRRMPLVIATTGHSEAQLSAIREASREIPIFMSSNMSVGVAVIADLVARAARAFPDADIEIVERHHSRKLDVPSGTAMILARAARDARGSGDFVVGRHENGRRGRGDIGIHSLRIGDDVGTHEVIIGTGRETLTLRHDSGSRALFADGALAAAAFLVGRAPGLYGMKDMLD